MLAMDKARIFRKALKEKRLNYMPKTLSFDSAERIRPCVP
jgi:hypothetical protein